MAAVSSPLCHGQLNIHVIAKRRYSPGASIPKSCLPFTQRLIVEPDDGLEPVREFINSAQNSLLIKQFTFTEPSSIAAVIDRKNAGVDVRVMLNASVPAATGPMTRRTSDFRMPGSRSSGPTPKFYVTHEKSIVVDEKAALVATFNLWTSTSR